MKSSEIAQLISADGTTPSQRLFALLEAIADKDHPFTLQTIAEEVGLPKPTAHRMLAQLEQGEILQRDGNGRHYSSGRRLLRLAETLLLNSTTQGARHAVLRRLVEEIGESCNLTAFSAGEVLYLDRVETAAPLRFYLHPGSRVPVHCSATGKLFLSQMPPAQRRRLLNAVPLERFTPNTLTEVDLIDRELEVIRSQGYAIDNEEFLPGLLCLGVLVPSSSGRSNMGIAVQGPVMRFSRDRAVSYLSRLQSAALAISQMNDELPQGASPQGERSA